MAMLSEEPSAVLGNELDERVAHAAAFSNVVADGRNEGVEEDTRARSGPAVITSHPVENAVSTAVRREGSDECLHAAAPSAPLAPSETPMDYLPQTCSSSNDWVTALDYSKDHVSSLHRGELWLLPSEAKLLLAHFKTQGVENTWSLKEVVPNQWHPPLPSWKDAELKRSHKRSKKQRKKLKKSSTSTSDHPDPQSSLVFGRSTAADEKPIKSQRVPKSYISGKNPTASSASSANAAQRAPRISQSQLKQLPDWAQRLHRILVLLCQTEVCRPFVPELLATDPRFPEVYDAIQPALTPLGLSAIVGKLEQNAYQSGLDVFNDVYSVWLCAYRTYTPGSPLWLQAYQASRTFLQQIANQPLKDDFGAPQSSWSIPASTSADFGPEGTEPEPALPVPAAAATGTARGRRKSASVDQLLQEFLTFHDKPVGDQPEEMGHHKRASMSGTTRGRSRGGGSATSAKRKTRVSLQAGGVITEAERASFQAYLSQLEARHHLMLFEAFRRTAVWKSIESGEVELDDARTSPPVFRKMIAWCRSQLAVKLPVDKRPRLHGSSPMLDKVTGSTSFVGGSGKFVPTATSGYDNGALKAAHSGFPETATRKHSAQALNVTSSSSSSCTSSSDDDDDDEGEEDDDSEHFTEHDYDHSNGSRQRLSSVLVT